MRIFIRIKNVENFLGVGIVIYFDVGFFWGLDIEFFKVERIVEGVDERMLIVVIIKDEIIVFNIYFNRKILFYGFFVRIFGILDRVGVVVDLISISEVYVSFYYFMFKIFFIVCCRYLWLCKIFLIESVWSVLLRILKKLVRLLF